MPVSREGDRKGQISVEYLIVMGFVVFIVTTILGIAFFYTSGVRDKISSNELNNFANKVISSAESVYFSGEPSKATITAYLPLGVESVDFIQDNLVLNFSSSSGRSTAAFHSDVPLDDNSVISPSEGLKRIRIVAGSDSVLITEE